MKKIRLENFKCYKKQEVEFKSGVNLLIGDNASGKTTIIRACRYALSSFFVGFSDENTEWNSIQKSDYTRSLASNYIVRLLPIKISFSFDDLFADNDIFSKNRDLYYLVKNTNKNSRTSIAGLKIYKSECSNLSLNYYNEDKRVLPLPLFAYFPAKDYENINSKDKQKFRDYYHIPSFGYYEALNDANNFKNWILRLLTLKEGGKNLDEIYVVQKAIVDVLGVKGCNVIFYMDIRVIQRSIYYCMTDGREIESSNLSDGYKRVINIVTELASRCAILNGGLYGKNACLETSGTVLIDEIDLHLHPTLQSTILKGLRNAFPKLQFIATTHAPMVMSSVESNDVNVVYKLDYSFSEGYSVNEVNTYGMDLSTISEVVLEQPPRNIEIEDKLNRLFDLIDDNKKEEALNLLKDMKGGTERNIPELLEAEALLNFIN